ncbi:hypothetical protein JCM33374_g5990 [Metschnikowia sp. JCM 33374]|nr:hypothetical protein JCM33374_g5990 [Metschnikowia sp. JCM 33374]
MSDPEKLHREVHRHQGNVDVDPQGNFVTTNPFAQTQLSSYSLYPKTVPNYVLDKLSSAHYKEQLKNSNVNTDQTEISPVVQAHSVKPDGDSEYVSFAHDPFIKSLNNNWANLLVAVKQPTEVPTDTLSKHESLKTNPDWETPWGGDERLRSALLGTSAGDHAASLDDPNVPWWRRIFSRKQPLVADDSPRHRTKAGYWMSDEKRKDLMPTLWRIFVQNPFLPLLLRVTILIFSVCALALAVSIYIYSNRTYENATIEQEPSTIFAIIVQSFAIPYIVYIAYDEYSGKPLGLRNPVGKMKLIMLDLLFIMCSSANMSLTFDSLYDEKWVCKADLTDPDGLVIHPTVSFLCRRQRALASFLLLVLALWVLTFTISIIRVVDRVSIGPRSD